MAMLSPCSIRKVPSVTRKLCSLVRIRSKPFNAPIPSEKKQREDDARPEAAGDLGREHRGGERGGRHGHAGREVELSADHQERDGDRRNADGRGLIEDRGEGGELPERRGDHPEEDEDEDRAAERARLGPLQDALPQGLGLNLSPRLRESGLIAGRGHGFPPLRLRRPEGAPSGRRSASLLGRHAAAIPGLSACRPWRIWPRRRRCPWSRRRGRSAPGRLRRRCRRW